MTELTDLIKVAQQFSHKDDIDIICSEKGGIDCFDGYFLYCCALSCTTDEYCVEFSPNHGYSTICIGLGLKRLGIKNALYTVELNEKVRKPLEANIAKYGLQDYVKVIWGDALVEVPKIIGGEDRQTALLFIDSDHTKKFAERYIEEIFPLVSPGCIVCIHDLCANKLSNGHNVSFKTSLKSGQYKSGEERPLKDYLDKNAINYFVTHAVTGGKHEAADLPRNDGFYEEVKEICGVDFRNNRMCPKTISFMSD